MELEIEDKLQEIYKNIIIEVNFKDFILYEIILKLEYQGVQYESKFEYKYDASLTIDANISKIEHIIDTEYVLFSVVGFMGFEEYQKYFDKKVDNHIPRID